MEALWVWKKNVQRCATVSGVLALSLGTVFGNLTLEDNQTEQGSKDVCVTKVQQMHDQKGSLPQLDSRTSLLKVTELTNIGEEQSEFPVYNPIVRTNEIPTSEENVVVQISEETNIVETTVLEMQEARNTVVREQQEPTVEQLYVLEDGADCVAEKKVMEETEAFLLDEEGMLYDLNMEQLNIEWGYLELPDNCMGIRSGALAKCGDSVEEIFLPASVTRIEANAFVGLSALGWIETAEENPAYYGSEGVLFTRDMMTLINFPASAIGIYKLSAEVQHIEEGAFTGSNLSILDSRQCGGMSQEDRAEVEAQGITII